MTETDAKQENSRPLTWPTRCLLCYRAIRDGLRGTLPTGGATPASRIEFKQFIAASCELALKAQTAADRLRNELDGLAPMIAGATEAIRRVTDELALLPGAPEEKDLPPRAALGDAALNLTLRLAVEQSKLTERRAMLLAEADRLRRELTQYEVRRAQIPGEIEALGKKLELEQREAAAYADRRVAFYSFVLNRWARDRKALEALLPLASVGDLTD